MDWYSGYWHENYTVILCNDQIYRRFVIIRINSTKREALRYKSTASARHFLIRLDEMYAVAF